MKPITEADVRRIVREELRAAFTIDTRLVVRNDLNRQDARIEQQDVATTNTNELEHHPERAEVNVENTCLCVN